MLSDKDNFKLINDEFNLNDRAINLQLNNKDQPVFHENSSPPSKQT